MTSSPQSTRSRAPMEVPMGQRNERVYRDRDEDDVVMLDAEVGI